LLTHQLLLCPKTRGPSQLHLNRYSVNFYEVTFKTGRMNFDEVLDRIGGFGRFQKTLYVWICLPQIFLAFHMLVSVFTGAVPPHLCRSAWPTANSGGPGPGLNFSLAPGESCTSFQDGPLSQLNHSLQIPEYPSSSNSCAGWEFSKEVFLSTIVTEVSTNL